MHLRLPYVQIWNILHFDFSGSTPLAERELAPIERLEETAEGIWLLQSSFRPASRRETLGRHSKGGGRGGGLKIDWTKPLPSAWPMCIGCGLGLV
jgi:hypothetical protein